MIRKITCFLMALVAALSISCGGIKPAANTAVTNTGNSGTAAKPAAIEITPDALMKEWLADSAATDEKYKGKTLSLTGEVAFVAPIGEEAYITLLEMATPDKKRGIKITCGSPITEDTKRLVYLTQEAEKMIERETNRKDIKVPSPKVTIKGVYKSSTPPEREYGTIDLKPCELEPLIK